MGCVFIIIKYYFIGCYFFNSAFIYYNVFACAFIYIFICAIILIIFFVLVLLSLVTFLLVLLSIFIFLFVSLSIVFVRWSRISLIYFNMFFLIFKSSIFASLKILFLILSCMLIYISSRCYFMLPIHARLLSILLFNILYFFYISIF